MITADTNVFVYTVDGRDLLKQRIAQDITVTLGARGARIPLQVIGEFQNAMRRRLRVPHPLAAERASNVLESFATFPASRSAARAALVEMSAGRLSYYDALMLASGAEAGCTVMLSEDMRDGGRVFGIEIVNPFGPSGLSSRAASLFGLS